MGLSWAVAGIPATAHDGKMTLSVASDGAAGLTVLAAWESDGHPLDVPAVLSATAIAGDGRRVGPVALEPTGEGQGFYAVADALDPGTWDVTVTASSPRQVSESATVVVAEAVDRLAAPAAEQVDEPNVLNAVTVGLLVALLVCVAAIMAWRRRP